MEFFCQKLKRIRWCSMCSDRGANIWLASNAIRNRVVKMESEPRGVEEEARIELIFAKNASLKVTFTRKKMVNNS